MDYGSKSSFRITGDSKKHSNENSQKVEKSIKLNKIYSQIKNKSYNSLLTSFKNLIEDPDKVKNEMTLNSILIRETPLIFLNKEQKDLIVEKAKFVKITHDGTIIYKCIEDIAKAKKASTFDLSKDGLHNDEKLILSHHLSHSGSNVDETRIEEEDNLADQFNCYIILEGEVHIFDKFNNFQEDLEAGSFFGFQGPIFKKRTNSAIANIGTVLCVISQTLFMEVLQPFSKFANYITKSVIYKDKFFESLDIFKSKVLSSINKEPIDIFKLLPLFYNMNSCLHPKGFSNEIDFSAWQYAVERLPPKIFDIFVFNLVNTSTKFIAMESDVFNKFISQKVCLTRNRSIYEYINGKYVVVLRDMETDVLDFMSNMCIHVSESRKFRNLIQNPSTYKALSLCKNDDEAIEIINGIYDNLMTKEDKKIIKKIFDGNNLAEKFIKMTLHYQDYSITIKKKDINRKDPAELWVQNIWKNCRTLLEVNASVDELEDLVIDISQGSKTTLLSCISPHMYKNKEKILNWAKENNVQFKTKSFVNENDMLIAASYYYYKEFKSEKEEKLKMDAEHGIVYLDDTFFTGVAVMLINVNKLSNEFKDPNIVIKPASKNHIILHLGYTFGAQSSLIISPLLMLFGAKARSLSIIGKAGGLTGNRTDILVADKMFHDKTHDLIPVQTGIIDIEKLSKLANCPIHKGPMLCVAGTILQNTDLLRFYKNVNGCVGLEMEGYYYIQEVDRAIKGGILDSKFITRCFYYASDLPLDPNQNLSMEGSNISWEEGVGSMLAIQRYVLGFMFDN